jgi:hypothetical protein
MAIELSRNMTQIRQIGADKTKFVLYQNFMYLCESLTDGNEFRLYTIVFAIDFQCFCLSNAGTKTFFSKIKKTC